MADSFNNEYTVDDILNEVREMMAKESGKQSSPKPNTITVDEIMNGKSNENADLVKPRPNVITAGEILNKSAEAEKNKAEEPVKFEVKTQPKKDADDVGKTQVFSIEESMGNDDKSVGKKESVDDFLSNIIMQTQKVKPIKVCRDAVNTASKTAVAETPKVTVQPKVNDPKTDETAKQNVIDDTIVLDSSLADKADKKPIKNINSDDTIVIDAVSNAESKLENDESIKNDKLKRFFSKTTESTYVARSEKAKRQISELYDDEYDENKPLFDENGKRVRPNLNTLSADEINNQAKKNIVENHISETPEETDTVSNDIEIVDVENELVSALGKNTDWPLTVSLPEDDDEQINAPIDLNEDKLKKKEFVKSNSRDISSFSVRVEEDSEEENEKDDVIDDYRTIDDAESVRYGLDQKISSFSKKAVTTFILTVLIGVFTLLPCLEVQFVHFVSPISNMTLILWANLILFIIALIVNSKTILHGLASLVKFKPDADTALSVAAIASLAQSLFAIYKPFIFESRQGFLYTSIVCAAMMFNLIGKRTMFMRVRRNFDLVATTGVKKSCKVVYDHSEKVITNGETDGDYGVVCSTPVLNLHDYLFNSFCEDPADVINSLFAPFAFFISIFAGIITYIFVKDVSQSLGAVALVSAAFVPFTALLASNVPMKRACSKVAGFGGLVSGFNAVSDYKNIEYAVFDDYEIFPAGSVELVNLLPVKDFSIDDAVMDAAALLNVAGGSLSYVLDGMIIGRKKSLKEVKNAKYIDGIGVFGTVGDDEYAVGNRAMMEDFGELIDLPDIETEKRLFRNNSFIVYFARNKQLCGMIVARYVLKDEEMREQLVRLTDSGVKMLIKSCDQNITSELVCKIFELNENSISIMPSHSVTEYESVTTPSQNGDSVIAHHNSAAGLACALNSAKRVGKSIYLAVVLQTILLVWGVALATYFTVSIGFAAVAPTYLLIYQLISAIITIVIPYANRI